MDGGRSGNWSNRRICSSYRGLFLNLSGACPWSPVLEELAEDQLVSILTDTKNALTKQYRQARVDGRRRVGILARRAARIGRAGA